MQKKILIVILTIYPINIVLARSLSQADAISVLGSSIVTIGIVGAIGYGLYKIISVKRIALTATDYGIKWLAWMVFIGTLSNLPRFLLHFDIDSFVKWIIVIVFFGVIAFVVGWIYGQFFGIK